MQPGQTRSRNKPMRQGRKYRHNEHAGQINRSDVEVGDRIRASPSKAAVGATWAHRRLVLNDPAQQARAGRRLAGWSIRRTPWLMLSALVLGRLNLFPPVGTSDRNRHQHDLYVATMSAVGHCSATTAVAYPD